MTDWSASTSAVTNARPTGNAGSGAAVVVDVAEPPKRKHAAIRIANAPALSSVVTSCVRPPHFTPRHWRSAKKIVTPAAISVSRPASAGTSAALYSPITIETAAVVPHVESQSLQPTMNPAYGPSARCEKAYCPPARGIIAPSSAIERLPSRA